MHNIPTQLWHAVRHVFPMRGALALWLGALALTVLTAGAASAAPARPLVTDAAQAPRPGLILLDIKLPKVDGHAVLEQIKNDNDKELQSIPTVMRRPPKPRRK